MPNKNIMRVLKKDFPQIKHDNKIAELHYLNILSKNNDQCHVPIVQTSVPCEKCKFTWLAVILNFCICLKCGYKTINK